MFPHRYFPDRYFARRYFPEDGAAIVVPPPPPVSSGGGYTRPIPQPQYIPPNVQASLDLVLPAFRAKAQATVTLPNVALSGEAVFAFELPTAATMQPADMTASWMSTVDDTLDVTVKTLTSLRTKGH